MDLRPRNLTLMILAGLILAMAATACNAQITRNQVRRDAYGAAWNSDLARAPSADAVYDAIIAMGGSPQDADLAAIAAANPVAGQILYWTAAGAVAVFDSAAYMRGLMDAANANELRPSLDLGWINVKDDPYLAKGDTLGAADGVAVAADATFTSATAAWAAADVGKSISIGGAGAGGVNLTTTIASINTATSVELTVAAGTSVNPASYTYGTDDTLAIQAAATALSGGRGTLYFPRGVYRVVHQGTDFDPTGNAILNRTSYMHWQDVNDIAIIGHNAKIVLDHDITDASLVLFSFYGCQNILIRGLHVDYEVSGSPDVVVNGYAMRSIIAVFRGNGLGQAAKNVTVQDCRLRIKYTGPDAGYGNNAGQADNTHAKLIGLMFYGDYPGEEGVTTQSRNENFRVINCDFYDCTSRTVWCWYADDILVQGSRFEDTGSNLPSLRILVGVRNVRVIGNRFVSNFGDTFTGQAITMQNQGVSVANGISRNLLVLGNEFVQGNNEAILTDGVQNVVIAQNTFRRHADASTNRYSVQIGLTTAPADANGIIVSGNAITNGRGIAVFKGERVSIQGNVLRDIGPLSGDYGAIHLSGEAAGVAVSGNRIDGSTYAGIVLVTPTEVAIRDNIIHDVTTGISTGAAVCIAGNRIDTCSSNGIYLAAGAGNSIITDNEIADITGRAISRPLASPPENVIVRNNTLDTIAGDEAIRNLASWIVRDNTITGAVLAYLLPPQLPSPATSSHDYAAGTTAWTMTAEETLAGLFTVTNASGAAEARFPAAVAGKQFTVYNNSGAAITFKVTGQTGVAVANGQYAQLVMNATDVVRNLATIYPENLTVTGDLTITGDDIFATTNTSGAIWVADGTNFNPVVMGGNATIGTTGTVALADDCVAAAEMADADHGDVSWTGGVATVEAATGDFAVGGDILNGTDTMIVIKTMYKTIDLDDDASTDDYQFDDDAENMTEQVITLTNILPAYAELVSCQLRCIETVTGSAVMSIDVGTTSGGNEIHAAANVDSANDISTTPAAGSPELAATNAARSVYVNATPGANWNTLDAGRWAIMLTYIDYGAVVTQAP